MKGRIALILIMLIGIAGSAAAMTEQEKIRALLDAVENSNLTFIRNGVAYSSLKAREHMEYKLKRAGSRIATADDFIRYIASRSSVSGSPYYLILKDETRVEAGDWLRGRLAELER